MASQIWRKRLGRAGSLLLAVIFLPAFFLLLLFPAWKAHAQEAYTATLFPLDQAAFPQISAYLDIHAMDGSFVADLSAADIQIIEAGEARPVQELVEKQSQMQMITAITFGHEMGVRDGLGLSRYDYLVAGLSNWEWDATQPFSGELSLLIEDGPEYLGLKDPGEWIRALKSYEANPREAEPQLRALSQAIEIAERTSDQGDIERAVLFITPPQPAEAGIGLQSLAARARQQRIRLFIWLVAPSEIVLQPEYALLENLANQTGGSLFLFTGTEHVPNLDSYLSVLRRTYYLTYQSGLRTSGVYPVMAEIRLGELTLSTNSQDLTITLLPPNPVFIGLPSKIVRAAGYNTQDQPTAADLPNSLLPGEQLVKILVEFQDGYSRPIQRTALYVDGALIAENTTPPFDAFRWDLTLYGESNTHFLKVEVIDDLGTTGSSLEMPVLVSVEVNPQIRLRLLLSERWPLLAGMLVMVTSALVFLGLILSGRIRPQPSWRRKKARRRPPRPAALPQRQPAHIAQENSERGRASWMGHWPRFPGRSPHKTQAYLVPLKAAHPTSQEAPPQEAPVPIASDEVIFGKDASQANWVIPDRALEDVHARLLRESEHFRLMDAGSIAGTWVNYTPVPPEGVLLTHGDLVHIGRVGFRFTLKNPKGQRKPILISQEPSR